MMKNYFKGQHFQKDIILITVGYYFKFSLSYRDIVEILRDHGIAINHTTIMRWVHPLRATIQIIMAGTAILT